jgi:ketosteroid isomerase-like protein
MKTAWITLNAKDSESAQNLKDSLLNLLALSGTEHGKVAYEVFRGTHKGVFHSPAGTLQPSGVSMQVNFCDVYKLRQGKIERADSYFDFYGLLRQLAPDKVGAAQTI